MDSPCFYGLTNPKQVRDIVIAVCSVLGFGGIGGFAVDLMAETACQETHLGRYRDPTPYGADRGLFQMDLIAFDDIRNRVNKNDLALIQKNFGFDIKKQLIFRLIQARCSPLFSAVYFIS